MLVPFVQQFRDATSWRSYRLDAVAGAFAVLCILALATLALVRVPLPSRATTSGATISGSGERMVVLLQLVVLLLVAYFVAAIASPAGDRQW